MYKVPGIEIEIDVLTNSIQNAISGDVFNTSIVPLYKQQSREIKKSDWIFDWQGQLRMDDREVYKLVIENNTNVLQGLASFSDRGDHMYMNLIESARFNKGASKLYLGVPGNLVAFGCKLVFEKQYLGYLAFDAKTALIEHYTRT